MYINRFDILSAQSSIYVSFCAPYNDASQYLYKEKIADETILKAVKLLTKERNSIWGVDTMNAYVHSNKLSPVPIDIQTTWDNIQDFMVTLWSQIESE